MLVSSGFFLIGALLALATTGPLHSGEHGHPAERLVFWYIQERDLSALTNLLAEYQPAVSVRDAVRHDPLLRAILADDATAMGSLVQAGAALDPENVPVPPLHLAIACASDRVVLYLIERDSGIDRLSEAGLSPLHVAAWVGNITASKVLLEKKARTDLRDALGRTPMHLASARGQVKMMGMLGAAGADVEAKSTEGRTPLLEAVHYGQTLAVQWLLALFPQEPAKRRTIISAQDALGRTALHLAAESNATEIITLLVAAGANVHARDQQGNTALHLAARSGNEDALRRLLDLGANPAAQNGAALLPLDLITAADASFQLLNRKPVRARMAYFLSRALEQKTNLSQPAL